MKLELFKDNELISLLIIFVVLSTAPLFTSTYNVRLLAVGLLYGLAAVGYNILYGYTGLISFGHAMFWSAGAYGIAIGLVKLHLDPILSIGFAFLITLVIAVITSPFQSARTLSSRAGRTLVSRETKSFCFAW